MRLWNGVKLFFRNNSGVNVIELLIGISLMTLFIFVSIPSSKIVTETQLKLEAIKLVNELRYMKNHSTTLYRGNVFYSDRKSTIPKLILDKKHHRYYVLESNNVVMVQEYSEDIEIYIDEIVFNVNGTAKNGTIILYKGKNKIEVIVDRAGRIRVN